MLIAHLAAFSGVISTNSLIGNNESSMWLWCFWQGGFPAVVTFFAFGKSSPLQSGDLAFTIAAMIGTTFVLTEVVTEGFPWLPVLLRNSRYTEAIMFGIGPLLFMLIILAFGSVMFNAGCASARREQTDLSMLMIDIDFFKSFNDCYGHPAGDRCIAAVGAIIGQQGKRPADLAVRFGGEEFIVLLPNTDKVGAFLLADRMLKAT